MKNTAQHIHLEATVPASLAQLRLDQALAEIFSDYSRSCLQSWLKQHAITVDGQYKRSKDIVRGGEYIIIDAQITAKENWQAQEMALEVVYEDAALLVINKPADLVVHPAAGNPDQTLINALLYYAPELANLPRAGLIHRIDKDTTGLLVIARTLSAHHHLVKQLQRREMHREYHGITQYVMTAGGTVDAPIGRHPTQRKRMAVVQGGKPAITHYRVIEKFHGHTWVRVNLETGRTHQIRVHMAHIHYPLLGDKLYGIKTRYPKNTSPTLAKALAQFNRQALHAKRLALVHPDSMKSIAWEIPLPDDMQQLITLLRQHNDDNQG